MLLIVALISAQVHACVATFVCPDGRVCKECSFTCPDESASEHQECVGNDSCASEPAADEDCSQCCDVQVCPGDDDTDSQLPAAMQDLLVAVLPLPQAPLVIPSYGFTPTFAHPECGRSHAPPGVFDSRGPPTPAA